MQHTQQQQPLLAVARPVQGLRVGQVTLCQDQTHAEQEGEHRVGLALHTEGVQALQGLGGAPDVGGGVSEHRAPGCVEVACGIDHQHAQQRQGAQGIREGVAAAQDAN